jgi:hypothetical protein
MERSKPLAVGVEESKAKRQVSKLCAKSKPVPRRHFSVFKGLTAMKISGKRLRFEKLLASLFSLACLASVFAPAISADITVGVDPTKTWNGYMNVFDLNRSGSLTSPGGFVFGSPWGFNDLAFQFSGSDLKLGVNSIGDPNPFWYTPSGGPGSLGNKWMDANGYVQVDDGSLSGINLTFSGTVLSNTFTANHTARVFIRDFAADYSSVQESSAILTNGAFSVSLATIADATRHVQYGFNVQGENVWITDIAPFGNVRIQAVPEPSSMLALSAFGVLAVASRRRTR